MQNWKNPTAPIFSIVHGSVVDGWGVRTTVFLKGCPLRCRWCCNPEGQKTYLELKYTAEDCDGCGRCVDACTQRAISMENGRAEVDRRLCNNCFACLDYCHTKALDTFGTLYTVEQLYREVMRDEPYFGECGGVTIGGGEATVYPEFTLELLQRLKAAYVHTALDTCGYITTELGLRCLEEADLALYDIKGLDRNLHVLGTGVSNDLILKNLEYRDSLGKEIIIRLPVIPGYTDSEANLKATAKLLSGLQTVKRVDLIPFHKYAEIKYRQLGLPIPKVFDMDFDKEREQQVLDIFLNAGLNAQLGG